jgi:hypothetical protein
MEMMSGADGVEKLHSRHFFIKGLRIGSVENSVVGK